jgi:hypothetical protein
MKCDIHEVDENFIFTHKYMYPYDCDGVLLEDLFEVWTISPPASLAHLPPGVRFRVTEETRSNLNSFDDHVEIEQHNIEDIEGE